MRYLLIFLCFLHTAKAQLGGKAFTFTGSVTGMPSGYVYLNYIDSANYYRTDSCLLQKGKFKFSGYVGSPHQVEFASAAGKDELSHPQHTRLFIEAGSIQGIFAASSLENHQLKGGKSTSEYTVYEAQQKAFDQKWKPALQAMQACNEGVEKEKNCATWNKAAPQYQQEKRMLEQQFILQHPQSYVSAYLLRGQMFRLPFDSLKNYYNSLSDTVQEGIEGSAIGKFIHKEESIAIGKPAPDFVQPDSNGAPVWLHDFKGQYVLLDVWASWCVPCREEHPYLRQAFAVFKNKGFTILSLSMDKKEDKQAWLNAIEKDSLSWPQLCDFTAYQNKVVSSYNVLGKGIPSNFLINPQGIIVAMNLRGEALEEKLTELVVGK